MSERFSDLASYPLQWPVAAATPLVLAIRWLLFLLVVAAVLWLMMRFNRYMSESRVNAERR
jgi:hypothetical protein